MSNARQVCEEFGWVTQKQQQSHRSGDNAWIEYEQSDWQKKANKWNYA